MYVYMYICIIKVRDRARGGGGSAPTHPLTISCVVQATLTEGGVLVRLREGFHTAFGPLSFRIQPFVFSIPPTSFSSHPLSFRIRTDFTQHGGFVLRVEG